MWRLDRVGAMFRYGINPSYPCFSMGSNIIVMYNLLLWPPEVPFTQWSWSLSLGLRVHHEQIRNGHDWKSLLDDKDHAIEVKLSTNTTFMWPLPCPYLINRVSINMTPPIPFHEIAPSMNYVKRISLSQVINMLEKDNIWTSTVSYGTSFNFPQDS